MMCDRCGANIDEEGALLQWGSDTKRLSCKSCWDKMVPNQYIELLFSWGVRPKMKAEG